MKKLMMTLAAGLTVSALLAVDSENIVGYQTLDITDGKLNMISVPWEAVGGGALSIQEMLNDPLGAGLQGGSIWLDNVADADIVKVWNPATSGYKDYYLYDSGGEYAGWDGQWIDNASGQPSTDPFAKGSTFWLLSKADVGGTTAVTQAGQAPAAASVVAAITAGKLNMVANPYPTAYELNGAAAPDLLAAGAQGGSIWLDNVADADILKVWNPATSGYKDYYLYDSGGEYAGWDGQWIDDSTGMPTEDALPIGKPFWYLSKGSGGFDFTFTKTY